MGRIGSLLLDKSGGAGTLRGVRGQNAPGARRAQAPTTESSLGNEGGALSQPPLGRQRQVRQLCGSTKPGGPGSCHRHGPGWRHLLDVQAWPAVVVQPRDLVHLGLSPTSCSSVPRGWTGRQQALKPQLWITLSLCSPRPPGASPQTPWTCNSRKCQDLCIWPSPALPLPAGILEEGMRPSQDQPARGRTEGCSEPSETLFPTRTSCPSPVAQLGKMNMTRTYPLEKVLTAFFLAGGGLLAPIIRRWDCCYLYLGV